MGTLCWLFLTVLALHVTTAQRLRIKPPCDQSLFDSTRSHGYAYESVVRTNLANQKNNSLVRLRAMMVVHPDTNCFYRLEVTSGLITTENGSNVLEQNTLRALAERPLLFRTQRGAITDLRYPGTEDHNILNIKRSMLSLFFNTVGDSETDINGLCKFHTIKTSGSSFVKYKNLSECKRNSKDWTVFQAPSFFNKLPNPINSTQKCIVELRNRQQYQTTCEETHIMHSLTSLVSGEVSVPQPAATVSIVVKVTRQQVRRPNVLASAPTATNMVDGTIQFQAMVSEFHLPRNLYPMVDVLLGRVVNDPQMKQGAAFSELVWLLRQLHYPLLNNLYQRYQVCLEGGRCPVNLPGALAHEIFLDGILFAMTDSSIALIRTLVSANVVSPSQAATVLDWIFFAKPELPYLDQAVNIIAVQTKPRTILGLGDLVHRVCTDNPVACKEGHPALTSARVFLGDLVQNCSTSFNDQTELTVAALKALAMTGLPDFMSLAAPCFQNSVANVSLIAMDTYSKMPCASWLPSFLELASDKDQDMELRAFAISRVTTCPSTEVFGLLLSLLEREPWGQIRAFLHTHLYTLATSSSPLHSESRTSLLRALGNRILEPYQGDLLVSQSRSFHQEIMGMGITADTQVTYHPNDLFPRNVRLNVGTHLFGENTNFLEVMARVEGVGSLLNSVFGANGIWSDPTVMEWLNMPSSAEMDDADRSSLNMDPKYRYLERGIKRFLSKVEQYRMPFHSSLLVRVLGQEVPLLNSEDINRWIQDIDDNNIIQLMMNLARGGATTFNKRLVVMDVSRVLPTSAGFQLRLDLTGSAVMSLNVDGKMDVRNLFWGPKKAIIKGHVKPRVSFGLAGRMAVITPFNMVGMALNMNFYTENSIKAEVSFSEGEHVLFNVEPPKEPVNLVDISSSAYMFTNNHVESVQASADGLVSSEWCAPFSGVIGTDICYSATLPMPKLHNYGVPNLLEGHVHLNLKLRSDPAVSGSFMLEAVSMPAVENKLRHRVSITAPGWNSPRVWTAELSRKNDADGWYYGIMASSGVGSLNAYLTTNKVTGVSQAKLTAAVLSFDADWDLYHVSASGNERKLGWRVSAGAGGSRVGFLVENHASEAGNKMVAEVSYPGNNFLRLDAHHQAPESSVSLSLSSSHWSSPLSLQGTLEKTLMSTGLRFSNSLVQGQKSSLYLGLNTTLEGQAVMVTASVLNYTLSGVAELRYRDQYAKSASVKISSLDQSLGASVELDLRSGMIINGTYNDRSISQAFLLSKDDNVMSFCSVLSAADSRLARSCMTYFRLNNTTGLDFKVEAAGHHAEADITVISQSGYGSFVIKCGFDGVDLLSYKNLVLFSHPRKVQSSVSLLGRTTSVSFSYWNRNSSIGVGGVLWDRNVSAEVDFSDNHTPEGPEKTYELRLSVDQHVPFSHRVVVSSGKFSGISNVVSINGQSLSWKLGYSSNGTLLVRVMDADLRLTCGQDESTTTLGTRRSWDVGLTLGDILLGSAGYSELSAPGTQAYFLYVNALRYTWDKRIHYTLDGDTSTLLVSNEILSEQNQVVKLENVLLRSSSSRQNKLSYQSQLVIGPINHTLELRGRKSNRIEEEFNEVVELSMSCNSKVVDLFNIRHRDGQLAAVLGSELDPVMMLQLDYRGSFSANLIVPSINLTWTGSIARSQDFIATNTVVMGTNTVSVKYRSSRSSIDLGVNIVGTQYALRFLRRPSDGKDYKGMRMSYYKAIRLMKDSDVVLGAGSYLMRDDANMRLSLFLEANDKEIGSINVDSASAPENFLVSITWKDKILWRRGSCPLLDRLLLPLIKEVSLEQRPSGRSKRSIADTWSLLPKVRITIEDGGKVVARILGERSSTELFAQVDIDNLLVGAGVIMNGNEYSTLFKVDPARHALLLKGMAGPTHVNWSAQIQNDRTLTVRLAHGYQSVETEDSVIIIPLKTGANLTIRFNPELIATIGEAAGTVKQISLSLIPHITYLKVQSQVFLENILQVLRIETVLLNLPWDYIRFVSNFALDSVEALRRVALIKLTVMVRQLHELPPVSQLILAADKAMGGLGLYEEGLRQMNHAILYGSHLLSMSFNTTIGSLSHLECILNSTHWAVLVESWRKQGDSVLEQAYQLIVAWSNVVLAEVVKMDRENNMVLSTINSIQAWAVSLQGRAEVLLKSRRNQLDLIYRSFLEWFPIGTAIDSLKREIPLLPAKVRGVLVTVLTWYEQQRQRSDPHMHPLVNGPWLRALSEIQVTSPLILYLNQTLYDHNRVLRPVIDECTHICGKIWQDVVCKSALRSYVGCGSSPAASLVSQVPHVSSEDLFQQTLKRVLNVYDIFISYSISGTNLTVLGGFSREEIMQKADSIQKIIVDKAVEHLNSFVAVLSSCADLSVCTYSPLAFLQRVRDTLTWMDPSLMAERLADLPNILDQAAANALVWIESTNQTLCTNWNVVPQPLFGPDLLSELGGHMTHRLSIAHKGLTSFLGQNVQAISAMADAYRTLLAGVVSQGMRTFPGLDQAVINFLKADWNAVIVSVTNLYGHAVDCQIWKNVLGPLKQLRNWTESAVELQLRALTGGTQRVLDQISNLGKILSDRAFNSYRLWYQNNRRNSVRSALSEAVTSIHNLLSEVIVVVRTEVGFDESSQSLQQFSNQTLQGIVQGIAVTRSLFLRLCHMWAPPLATGLEIVESSLQDLLNSVPVNINFRNTIMLIQRPVAVKLRMAIWDVSSLIASVASDILKGVGPQLPSDIQRILVNPATVHSFFKDYGYVLAGVLVDIPQRFIKAATQVAQASIDVSRRISTKPGDAVIEFGNRLHQTSSELVAEVSSLLSRWGSLTKYVQPFILEPIEELSRVVRLRLADTSNYTFSRMLSSLEFTSLNPTAKSMISKGIVLLNKCVELTGSLFTNSAASVLDMELEDMVEHLMMVRVDAASLLGQMHSLLTQAFDMAKVTLEDIRVNSMAAMGLTKDGKLMTEFIHRLQLKIVPVLASLAARISYDTSRQIVRCFLFLDKSASILSQVVMSASSLIPNTFGGQQYWLASLLNQAYLRSASSLRNFVFHVSALSSERVGKVLAATADYSMVGVLNMARAAKERLACGLITPAAAALARQVRLAMKDLPIVLAELTDSAASIVSCISSCISSLGSLVQFDTATSSLVVLYPDFTGALPAPWAAACKGLKKVKSSFESTVSRTKFHVHRVIEEVYVRVTEWRGLLDRYYLLRMSMYTARHLVKVASPPIIAAGQRFSSFALEQLDIQPAPLFKAWFTFWNTLSVPYQGWRELLDGSHLSDAAKKILQSGQVVARTTLETSIRSVQVVLGAGSSTVSALTGIRLEDEVAAIGGDLTAAGNPTLGFYLRLPYRVLHRRLHPLYVKLAAPHRMLPAKKFLADLSVNLQHFLPILSELVGGVPLPGATLTSSLISGLDHLVRQVTRTGMAVITESYYVTFDGRVMTWEPSCNSMMVLDTDTVKFAIVYMPNGKLVYWSLGRPGRPSVEVELSINGQFEFPPGKRLLLASIDVKGTASHRIMTDTRTGVQVHVFGNQRKFVVHLNKGHHAAVHGLLGNNNHEIYDDMLKSVGPQFATRYWMLGQQCSEAKPPAPAASCNAKASELRHCSRIPIGSQALRAACQHETCFGSADKWCYTENIVESLQPDLPSMDIVLLLGSGSTERDLIDAIVKFIDEASGMLGIANRRYHLAFPTASGEVISHSLCSLSVGSAYDRSRSAIPIRSKPAQLGSLLATVANRNFSPATSSKLLVWVDSDGTNGSVNMDEVVGALRNKQFSFITMGQSNLARMDAANRPHPVFLTLGGSEEARIDLNTLTETRSKFAAVQAMAANMNI